MVDLDIGPGELVALAGPNGSGKTTLIRTVLGLLPADAGSVELFGVASASLSPRDRARQVAWVPQGESARDNVRLRDYVLYGRYAHQDGWEGVSARDRDVADRALRDAGLADRADEGILNLSGGERQRAILARALAQETPLLLLDEPTSHLDIGHQLDLLDRVRSLAHDRHVTVVAALHDLNLAARYTDRVVVLSRGRIVADGPPAQNLSEELLARVWGVDAERRVDLRTGVPYLIPHRLLRTVRSDDPLLGWGPVHVVGGGGSAAAILRMLADEGIRTTVGPLNLLDDDADVAEALGIPSVVEAPFAPVSTESRQRAREMMAAARAIVIAPFPVGPSNLSNLEDPASFLGQIPLFLWSEPTISARDFTGGRAEAAWQALRGPEAREISSLPALREALRALAAGTVAAAPVVAQGAHVEGRGVGTGPRGE